MSLTAALNTARSSLQATATQVSVSSRNVSGASDPSYSRKLAQTVTTADGTARVVTITRAQNSTLYTTMLTATSNTAGKQAIAAGLDQLSTTLGDPEAEQSPAALLSQLSVALSDASNKPGDKALAQAVVSKAAATASSLNEASAVVQNVRQDADAEMTRSVETINDLLGKLETLNGTVVQGSFAGADVTDQLDQRDQILAKLSEQIGISVVTRANNDVVVYADSGVTLFETRARKVSFEPSAALPAGATGNPVFVDGVPVTGQNATMPIRSGALAGLSELRDTIAATYQSQLDEIGRGLVEAFAESDQSGGGGADRTGLFTWTGGPSVPASGAVATGIAATIAVNPAVDPSQGGQLALLRDGGINGAAYSYNPAGASGYPDRLDDLTEGLAGTRGFDAATGLAASQSLMEYGRSSAGWLEGYRQQNASAVTFQETLLSRASEALSNQTGVNLDDEYALQLQLEQSYSASSRIFGVINDLFKTLMNNVG